MIADLAHLGVSLDGSVGPAEGARFLVLSGLLVAGIWWFERDIPAIGELCEMFDDEEQDEGRSPATGLALALVAVAAMAGGGWLAVAGAERRVELAGSESTRWASRPWR